MNIKETKNAFAHQEIDKPTFITKMHSFHSVLFDFAQNLKDTDVQKIEIQNDRVLFTVKHKALDKNTEGVTFFVDPHDHRVTPVETFNFNSYEYNDYKVLSMLLENGNTFMDIGTNVGFHSLSLAKQFKKSFFYAFEPVPKTYNYLKENLSLNSLENVSIYNCGISDKKGELDFFFYPEGSGNASSRNLSNRADAIKVSSPVVTLDDFVASKDFKHERVNFIKCDVEGAELFAFLGGRKTIERFRPIVFSEILRKWAKQFDYHPNEIFTFFKEMSYSAYVVTENCKLSPFKQMDDETKETNFFFIPNERNIEKFL